MQKARLAINISAINSAIAAFIAGAPIMVNAQVTEVAREYVAPRRTVVVKPQDGTVKEVTEKYVSPESEAIDTIPIAAPSPVWSVGISDVNLAGTFARWAKSAGYQFRWDAAKNISVEAPGVIKGTFEEALVAVLESPGVAKGGYPLEACIYPNHPQLVRITRLGEQSEECK